VILLITAALLISNAAHWPTYIGPLARIVGAPELFIRMSGIFCAGSCYYVLRDRIPFRPIGALVSLLALVICLRVRWLAEPAVAIFGGYLIFWIALHFRSRILLRINNGSTDISYGTYLYAWPIEMLLLYFFQIHSPLLVMSLTIPLAFLAGYLSWHLVERPFVNLPRRTARPT
jgi:peptidoglycan/LPS O-acetylase OafA/YrhL